MDPNSTPDLATILKTLAALGPQAHVPAPQASQSQSQYHQPPPQEQYNPQQTTWHPPRQEYPRSTTPPGEPIKKQDLIDPATIIEWSAGLKCVMKTVAKHENILTEIKRMIKVQQEHEEQWWNGRKALIERQAARKEGQKKLDEVLKAVGGTALSNPTTNHAEETAFELQTYDLKVYKAQLAMVREMTSRLKGYGVPFFGTRGELVCRTSREKTEKGKEGKGAKGMIEEEELVELQKKMLGILEDLCCD